jgi:hypothetical protein
MDVGDVASVFGGPSLNKLFMDERADLVVECRLMLLPLLPALVVRRTARDLLIAVVVATVAALGIVLSSNWSEDNCKSTSPLLSPVPAVIAADFFLNDCR